MVTTRPFESIFTTTLRVRKTAPYNKPLQKLYQTCTQPSRAEMQTIRHHGPSFRVIPPVDTPAIPGISQSHPPTHREPYASLETGKHTKHLQWWWPTSGTLHCRSKCSGWTSTVLAFARDVCAVAIVEGTLQAQAAVLIPSITSFDFLPLPNRNRQAQDPVVFSFLFSLCQAIQVLNTFGNMCSADIFLGVLAILFPPLPGTFIQPRHCGFRQDHRRLQLPPSVAPLQ